jgi:hypothetical protein
MKTLWMQPPGQTGVLVIDRQGKQKERVMKFKDGCEALHWCEKKRVMFIYLPVEPPGNN